MEQRVLMDFPGLGNGVAWCCREVCVIWDDDAPPLLTVGPSSRPGVVRSLDRDKKYATERMEALKLVRKIAVRAPPLVCHTNTGCV